MTTARDVVNDALYGSGILGQGETATNADAQLVLRRFARLLDSWSNSPDLCYDIYQDTLALTGGTPTYLSSLLAGGRPVAVDSIFIRLNGVDYTVELVGNQTYDAAGYKAATGMPFICYVDASVPDSTFKFYPTPWTSLTAYISCRRNLRPASMTLDTVLAYPPGYERMLVDQLAMDICPSFGKPVPPDLRMSARESKQVISAANYSPTLMNVSNRERRNIFTGP